MPKRKEALAPVLADYTFEKSSGNVFADLGCADAADMLLKAELSIKIGKLIKDKRLSQEQAGSLMGLTQPKLSDILRGKLRGISINKLTQCLHSLGQDVKVSITVSPARRGQIGHFSVTT